MLIWVIIICFVWMFIFDMSSQVIYVWKRFSANITFQISFFFILCVQVSNEQNDFINHRFLFTTYQFDWNNDKCGHEISIFSSISHRCGDTGRWRCISGTFLCGFYVHSSNSLGVVIKSMYHIIGPI